MSRVIKRKGFVDFCRRFPLYIYLCMLLNGNVQAEHFIEQEEIISSIRHSIRFSDNIVQADKQKDYIESIDVDSILKGVLPSRIDCGSKVLSMQITSAPVEIWIDDPEIARLIIKRSAMEIMLMADQVKRISSVSQDDKDMIVGELNMILDSAKKCIKLKLGKLIPEELIDQKIVSVQNRLLREIDDQLTYWMKEPMGESSVEHIISVFEGRLELTFERAERRLGNASLESHPEKTSEGGERQLRGKSNSEYETACASILNETLSPLTSAVRKATSIDELVNLNPDTVVPGYSDVVSRIEQKREEAFFAKNELKRQEIEKQQAMQAIIAEHPLEATLQRAITDLGIEGEVFMMNDTSIPTVESNDNTDKSFDNSLKMKNEKNANQPSSSLLSVAEIRMVCGIIVVVLIAIISVYILKRRHKGFNYPK